MKGLVSIFDDRPQTPLGEEEEQRIHDELVSKTEVSKLIQNDIWPLGSRIPKEVYGNTLEEQIKRVSENLYRALKVQGIELKADDDILKKVAEDYLKNYTPNPDECIEERS